MIVNADPGLADRFWLTRDYLRGFVDLIPEQYLRPGYWQEELERLLGKLAVQAVPIPHDCCDGFYPAYWRRPHAYLDQQIRASISVFHRLPAAEVSQAMDELQRDLDEGRWQERNASLLDKPELDVGLRFVIAS